MRGFAPEAVLQPVNDVIRQINDLTDQINGRVLLRPLYEQVDVLAERAESISPASLLTPLQAPYDTMMATVHRLDPATWVTPLETLYTEIDGLIDYIDITPLLDELDHLQRQWFAEARTAILGAADGLNLPEPLQSFFGSLRPVLEAMTDALFGDPQEALHQLRADLPSQFKLTLLFEPLDAAFDQLLELLHSVPPDDLTSAINAIREDVGMGLVTLDPRTVIGALRTGQSRLEELAPLRLLSTASALAQIRLSFQAKVSAAPSVLAGDIAAVNARFDAVFGLTSPDAGQIASLTDAHDSLVKALRVKINQLDTSGAHDAYQRVRQGLARLLPAFMFSRIPLSHADVLNGFYAMRPSVKAARLEVVLGEFLSAVAPLEENLADGMNRFFGTLREIASHVSPLSIKGAVEEVYATLRAKVRILHPDALTAALRENFYDPLLEPLAACNPERLEERLSLAFERMLAALTGSLNSILDSIVGVVDDRLRAIRAAIRALLGQIQNATHAAVESLKRVIDRLDQLVFVEILERLNRVMDSLGDSFRTELDRVRSSFDDMLGAIPLGGGSASAGVGGAA
jgi:hypothetical protein